MRQQINENVQAISASLLFNMMLCGKAVEWERVYKIPATKTLNTAGGIAFHKIIETGLRNKISGGSVDLIAMVEPELETAISSIKINKDENYEEDKSILMDQLLSAVKIFQEYYLATIRPKAVEAPFTIYIEHKGETIPITGYIDCILEDDTMIDWKFTGKQNLTLSNALPSIQMCTYALYDHQQTGRDITPFKVVEFVKYNRAKAYKDKPAGIGVVDEVRLFKLQEHDRKAALDAIIKYYKMLKAEIYTPSWNSWKCTPKQCGYWGICRGGGLSV